MKNGALKRVLATLVAVLLALSPGVPHACEIADPLAVPPRGDGYGVPVSSGADAHDATGGAVTVDAESNRSPSGSSLDRKAIHTHAGCASAAMFTPAEEQALPMIGNGSRPPAAAMERFVSFIFAPPEPRPKR